MRLCVLSLSLSLTLSAQFVRLSLHTTARTFPALSPLSLSLSFFSLLFFVFVFAFSSSLSFLLPLCTSFLLFFFTSASSSVCLSSQSSSSHLCPPLLIHVGSSHFGFRFCCWDGWSLVVEQRTCLRTSRCVVLSCVAGNEVHRLSGSTMLCLSNGERRAWLGQISERLFGRLKRRRVWSSAIGDCAPGRGEHLDDDVPIVQQAEQAADAADSHMSVGKMEVISRAAAKMTNSASVSKFANKFTSYSIDSSLIIVMTAKHYDRKLWELGTREGPRENGATAARTPNRTLDWKRAMHTFSHITALPARKARKSKLRMRA